MRTKVRYIIQELIGSEWTLAAARDSLTAILHVWEDTYLPIVAQDKRKRGAYACTRARGFRMARMTPNALTIIDPADHSEHHRLTMRKIELERR